MRIEFIPSDEIIADTVPVPCPASAALPEWFVSMPTGAGTPTFRSDGSMRKSFKSCMPFADALKFGYVQKSWADLFVDSTGDRLQFAYAAGPTLLSSRDQPLPKSDIFHTDDVAFHMPWIPKLPKQYSILITHPFNRLDLPFHVTSGVIDADEFFHSPMGAVPISFHRNFRGTIRHGTPLFQMVPFRRDKWTSKTLPFDLSAQRKRSYVISRQFIGAYRDNFWKPKRFSAHSEQHDA